MEVKRPIIELMLKSYDAELMKNYSNEFYGPLKRSNETKHDEYILLHIAGAIGILIVIFTNFNFDKEKLRNKVLFVIKSPALKDFLYVTICFLMSLIFVPILLLCTLSFVIYRKFVQKSLASSKSSSFKGFLSGEDSFWVCEDDVSKSVINVLAYVKGSQELDGKLHERLLESIRNRIYTKLMLTNQFPKMFYQRKRDESGYFYWTDENQLTINDYVRLTSQSDQDFMTEDDLKDLMSDICNEPLPASHSALWECLISKQAVQFEDGVKYPVRFFKMCLLADQDLKE